MSTVPIKALLQPAACLLAVLAVACGVVALAQQPTAPPDEGGGGFDPAGIALQLPPLPAADGAVELPLAGDSPFAWVAIGGGPGVEHVDGHLQTRYVIAGGQPTGAALIFPPGTLAGLETIEIEIRGNRSTQLVPTLRDVDGVVYRLPSVPVQAGGPRTYTLSAEDMSYFPGQSDAADPGSFDASGAVLLSLVDISGFTGAVPPGTEVEWTVSRLTARVGARAAEVGGRSAATALPAEAASAPGPSRHPMAERAEARFFDTFNHRAQDRAQNRAAALPELMAAYASDPGDARTNLWLGLNHLWLAAEGDRTDPRVIENLILAEHFLARAERLHPADRRIPSWLVPTRQALAQIDGDAERIAALDADLLAVYREDPAFHSVAVAMAGFRAPRGSDAFVRGLEALRASDAECAESDPTCGNGPRWPHNVEGFFLLRTDYELKAGNRDTARALLENLQTAASYADWPYRGEVEDRLAHLGLYADLFTNDDPGDDPPTLPIGTRDSCQVCHRAD